MYYIYGNIRAIPTYRVYRLYDIHVLTTIELYVQCNFAYLLCDSYGIVFFSEYGIDHVHDDCTCNMY